MRATKVDFHSLYISFTWFPSKETCLTDHRSIFFFLRSHDSLHFHVPIFKLNCTLLWMKLSKRTVEERDEKWIASGIGPKTQKMSYKNAGNICLNCICIVAFSTEFLSSVKHLFKLFYSFIHFRWCRFSLCPVFVLFSLGMFHINNQLLEVESNEIKKKIQ